MFGEFEPVVAFRIKQGAAPLGCDGCSTNSGVLHISICVIPMVMRVKDVADWFISIIANCFDHFICLSGKIGIDHQYEVFEDYPTLVAAGENRFCLCFAEEDAWR